MSLQVWLPFTDGTLKQQGLLDSSVTATGTTSFTNGKLGKALSCNGSSYWSVPGVTLGSSVSIACWGKTSTGSKMLWVLESDASDILNFYWSSIYTLNTGDSNNNPFQTDSGSNISVLTDGNWHHFVVTFDSSVSKLYIDGEYAGKAKTFRNPTTTNKKIKIGGGYRNGHSYDWNGAINDFRLYDHCLSPMEVKRISQGLILHYPLNRGGLGPSNLIRNGFGELGSENWDSNTSISTSDIPSGQSDIKASFNGHTVEHVRIYPEHTYKISAWIKATTTSGNTYPSLYPYDVDGEFIQYYNCPSGFNLNTMTTLKQQLKTGDTKIYVNDLSQWNTNSGHYYNFAAIFDYTDSTGYTYPDGTYTRHIAQFGSGTSAKTNLDKTNNVITLTTAYTGPNKPAGTKLCASTAGAGYFYPWGTINLANIQNWTYKETTFSGDDPRLRYAKTVIFWTYNNNRMAGIKMIDLTNESLDTAAEYDSSGYCHNANRASGHDNLWENSSCSEDLVGMGQGTNKFTITTKDGYKCAHLSGQKGVTSYLNSVKMVPEAGAWYTISADMRIDNYSAGTTNPYVGIYFGGDYLNTDNTGGWYGGSSYSGDGKADNHTFVNTYNNAGWHRVSCTVQYVHGGSEYKKGAFSLGWIYARDFTGDLYVKNIKFEKGKVATSWTPGSYKSYTTDSPKYNVSAEFDGVDSATVPSIFDSTTRHSELTTAAWVKRTSDDANWHYYWYSQGISLDIRPYESVNNYYNVNWTHATDSSSRTNGWINNVMPLNTWVHDAWVFDHGVMKHYVNGELAGTSDRSSTGTYILGDVTGLMGGETSTSHTWQGGLSDFRIYATALSATDIKSLYQNSATIDADGTIHGAIR